MNFSKRGTIVLVIMLAIVATPATAAVYFNTSAPGIITKGDPFSISGTGAVNGTVAVWIVGRDHFEVLTTAPDRHGNFSITIKPSATDIFSSGQYAILYQDPGAGGDGPFEGVPVDLPAPRAGVERERDAPRHPAGVPRGGRERRVDRRKAEDLVPGLGERAGRDVQAAHEPGQPDEP